MRNTIVRVNEVSYQYSSINGSNIVIKNGKVIIDGQDVTPDQKEINIVVEGSVENLTVSYCEQITVNENVNNLNSNSGKVNCLNGANVINANSGNVKIIGDVKGNVTTNSGDVECEKISGNVKTLSGNINF